MSTMIPPRSPIQALLDANARWADAVDRADPDFFRTSAQRQQPKVLWIGCADSRVPETVLTGARPGDLFVHRNIANQFPPNDDSALAVLSFAVDVVGVEHVVVAGHSHCGGAMACYHKVLASRAGPTGTATATTATVNEEDEGGDVPPETPYVRWLAPLAAHVASLDLSDTTPESAVDLIVRENVKRQVEHVCASATIQKAWAGGRPIWVHGWVYDIASGRIKDLEVSRGPVAV